TTGVSWNPGGSTEGTVRAPSSSSEGLARGRGRATPPPPSTRLVPGHSRRHQFRSIIASSPMSLSAPLLYFTTRESEQSNFLSHPGSVPPVGQPAHPHENLPSVQ